VVAEPAVRVTDVSMRDVQAVPLLSADDVLQLQELDGTGAALAEVIDIFGASLEERLASIHAAMAAGDLRALKTALHTLKGAAGMIGAARLARCCATLESATVAGLLPSAHTAEQIRLIAEESVRALRAVVSG